MKVPLLLLLLCCAALARIGETLEQLRSRFGEDPQERVELPNGLLKVVFKSGGIICEAVLVEGTVSSELYHPVTEEGATAIRNKQATKWEDSAKLGGFEGKGWTADTGIKARFSLPPGTKDQLLREYRLALWDGRSHAIDNAARAKDEADRKSARSRLIDKL